MTLGSDTSFTI